jgi:catechol 2,3-dioxygenase-like lactoylglutathione lyase family enzyme
VRLAGLCHAVYGTAGFGTALLPLHARSEVAEAIGRRAEALVYLYASCDRDDLYPQLRGEGRPMFRNRFTGRSRRLSDADLRAFLEISAANELDVLRHDASAARHERELGRLFTDVADLLSPAAQQAWGVARPDSVPAFTITRLDHLVLTVADVAQTTEFYRRVLGMQPITFGGGRRALAFGRSKINLHQRGNEVRPHAARPVPGSADLCLVTESPIDDVMGQLAAHGVAVEEGPVLRTGALGPILSCYLRDPDGNLVEISTYTTEQDDAGGAGGNGA